MLDVAFTAKSENRPVEAIEGSVGSVVDYILLIANEWRVNSI